MCILQQKLVSFAVKNPDERVRNSPDTGYNTGFCKDRYSHP